ncbi:MAG: chromate transporter [Methylocystaceae bacterium]
MWNNVLVAFLFIGAISFGGGFAVIPVMESELVNRFGLLSASDLYNMVTLAQVAPGPVAVNASTLAGYSIGGLGFALLATLSLLIAPALITMLLVSVWERLRQHHNAQSFIAGLKPVVVALVASAGVGMASRSTHDMVGAVTLIIATLAATRLIKRPLVFISGSLIISLAYALLRTQGWWV